MQSEFENAEDEGELSFFSASPLRPLRSVHLDSKFKL
jgi:hypothetical protein